MTGSSHDRRVERGAGHARLADRAARPRAWPRRWPPRRRRRWSSSRPGWPRIGWRPRARAPADRTRPACGRWSARPGELRRRLLAAADEDAGAYGRVLARERPARARTGARPGQRPAAGDHRMRRRGRRGGGRDRAGRHLGVPGRRRGRLRARGGRRARAAPSWSRPISPPLRRTRASIAPAPPPSAPSAPARPRRARPRADPGPWPRSRSESAPPSAGDARTSSEACAPAG